MVEILEETTKNPLTLMGKCAGICYNAPIKDSLLNKRRGQNCLKSNHGRVLEYPQIYMVLDGYSAKVIREFYTHIGGAPTRLQESTRYINLSDFNYIIPLSIKNSSYAKEIYEDIIDKIKEASSRLQNLGIKKEDVSMLYPLCMESKIIVRTNLRQLIEMSHQRLCSRAFWEFRNLMFDIRCALGEYSDEWDEILKDYYIPKCEFLGYCPEEKSCGKILKKNN